MADRYIKCETKITCSPNADYSDPHWVYEPEDPEELSEEAVERIDNLQIGTSSETFMRTDRYSALSKFYVKNKDASNYVTLGYTSVNTTANSIRILPGAEVTIPDVNPATSPTLQANGASVLVDVLMCGES